MNWNGIFSNVDETNSEAEEVRKDGHTRDGQLQLHAHLTGSSFRGETISTMLEVGLTSFSLLTSELLKTLQKEKKLITRPDTCKKE